MKSLRRLLPGLPRPIAMAALILGGLSAFAQNLSAPTMKPATSITTCGTIITAPGTYVLANNLSCSEDAIHVNASDVTLELGGFSISSSCINGCTPTQTGVLASDPAGGPISNLKILAARGIGHFPIGVSLVGVRHSQLTGVSVYGSTTCLSLNSSVNGATPQNNLFSANSFSDCGVAVDGTAVQNSKFIGNQCSGHINGTGVGIHILNGGGNLIKGNRCAGETIAFELGGNGSTGTTLNSLTGNTATTSSTGILVGFGADYNTFTANYSYFNTLDIDEENAGCGNDVWIKNVFSTSNQSCVH